MRASTQEQKGGTGTHEVAANFERIGWGVALNSQHDLGTDLFLMARDPRLIDLGMLVGAQVKAGPTFFKEEVRDQDGNVTGWWFRESRTEHFDAWLNHQLPHIIVLHDLYTRVSYWAHINREAVTYTDKGAKILVPATNTVDEGNVEKLLEVAASNASRANWEGSAWSGVQLSPNHRLRHALLVPRLIAPHPNRGLSLEPTAVEVVAMLVQVRLSDVYMLSEKHSSMPDLDALAPDASWEWKFAAGMRNFIRSGNPDALAALVDVTRPPHEQAAATVAYAAALLENGRADEALEALDALLRRDELDLVDHAWVQLQHARALGELGRRQEARDEALGLVSLSRRAPKDVTAAAIGGAAAEIVFTFSDWSSNDLETTITATDTTASWWRQQVSSWGLSEQAEQQFRAWARDDAVTIGGGDAAWRHLRSASLLASFAGQHSAWRHATMQLASHRLIQRDRNADPDVVAAALTALRRCGDHQGLRLAVRRIVEDGPATAAQAAALEVNPERSTHTSAQADLRMLIQAGDLLPSDRAEYLAGWAQRTFLDPSVYTSRIQPTFFVGPMLVDLLASLMHAVGEKARQDMADFVLGLPVQSDQLIASHLARLVRRFPTTVWTSERAERAVERARIDHWELTYPLLEAAAAHVSEVRERLEAEAREGSLSALGALGDVRNLETELVESLIESLSGRLELLIEEAAQGVFHGSVFDLGRAVTLLNVWHPKCANWEIIYRLLESVRWGEYLGGALTLLADVAMRLPSDVADKLIPLAKAIAESADEGPRTVPGSDPRSLARRLLARLQHRAGESSAVHLATLARGNLDDRCVAARLAHDMCDELSMGILVGLTGDAEPRVRARAAHAIARRAAAGDPVARLQLPQLIRDRGVLVAQAIAAVVADHPHLAALEELQPLRVHISARVRFTFLALPTPRLEGSATC